MKFRGIEVPSPPFEGRDINSLLTVLLPQIESINTEFEVFKEEAGESIAHAQKLLKTQISPDPVQIELDFSELSAYYDRIGELAVDAESFVSVYDIINHCPKKDKGMSEADRKKYTALLNISQINLSKQLKRIEDRLKTRISILQSILKHETARYMKDV